MREFKRRTFATPLVITLAAATGCKKDSPPEYTHNPPQPEDQRNPPEPGYGSGSGSATPDAAVAVATPDAADVKIGLSDNPPPPMPRHSTWHVMGSPNGGNCSAVPNAPCPEPKPGEPRMSCNPPQPAAYACPKGIAAPFTVDQFGDGADAQCTVASTMKCDPGEKCNPPAPTKVPCPKYGTN